MPWRERCVVVGPLLLPRRLSRHQSGMGWLFAVALGMQERRIRAVWLALVPLGIGHTLAIGAVIMIAAMSDLLLPIGTCARCRRRADRPWCIPVRLAEASGMGRYVRRPGRPHVLVLSHGFRSWRRRDGVRSPRVTYYRVQRRALRRARCARRAYGSGFRDGSRCNGRTRCGLPRDDDARGASRFQEVRTRVPPHGMGESGSGLGGRACCHGSADVGALRLFHQLRFAGFRRPTGVSNDHCRSFCRRRYASSDRES